MASPNPGKQPPRHPRHPPRSPGGSPPVYHPPGTPQRPSRISRELAIQRARGAVRNALMESGTSPSAALHLANVLLSHKGVQIGRGGSIFYHGEKFTPQAFASSPLANIATGKTAELRNEKAIEGDPGYIQQLANLALQRDQSTAGLEDQRRQALIQFGDPSFAGADANVAGAAAANPFGTSQLLAKQYADQQAAARNAANRSGTLGSGAETAGLGTAQYNYAGQNQQATLALQQLLASLDQQRALSTQAYTTGQQQARLDAYNALLASGAITAAQAPAWGIGRYRIHHNRRPPGAGGGGAPGLPAPPQPPGRGTVPTQTSYPTGGPIVYNPGQYGTQPPRVPVPPTSGYPLPTPDYYRRYGL